MRNSPFKLMALLGLFAWSIPQFAGATEFVPNKGQLRDVNGSSRPELLYKSSVGNTDIYVTATGLSQVIVQAPPDMLVNGFHKPVAPAALYRVDLNFLNTNPTVQIIPSAQTAGVLNFYTNGDAIAGVAAYQTITYRNLYNNIDMVLTNNGGLVYQFLVRQGGNINDIRFTYGTATDAILSAEGITVNSPLGRLTLPLPVTSVAGLGLPLPLTYVKTGEVFSIGGGIFNNGFSIGGGTDAYPTQLFPTYLRYGSYLGSPQNDYLYDVATDPNGQVTVGTSNATGYPLTPGASNYSNSFNDAVITRFDNVSNRRTFSTYLGGDGFDEASGVALAPSSGNIYVTGYTSSSNLSVRKPLPGSSAPVGTTNAFIGQFNPANGALGWLTYFGTSGLIAGNAIAVDASENVYVGGMVLAGGTIPLTGVNYGCSPAGDDGFIVKITNVATSPAIAFSALIGSNGSDNVSSLAYDKVSNSVYIYGYVEQSNGFPAKASGQQYTQNVIAQGAPLHNAFIMRINAADGANLWATPFGGGLGEQPIFGNHGHLITTDGNGYVYITGTTLSSPADFPLMNAYQSTNTGIKHTDIYVAGFDDTNAMIFSTYFGGADIDQATCISSNADGQSLIIGGATYSKDLVMHPSSESGFNTRGHGEGLDGLLFSLNGAGFNGGFNWSTLVGNSPGNENVAGVTHLANRGFTVAVTTDQNSGNYGLPKHNSTASAALGGGGALDYSGANDGYFAVISGNSLQKREAAPEFIKSTDLSLQVYPNPASNELTVQLKGAVKGEVQVELFNMMGQKVFTTSNTAIDGQYRQTLNCTQLSKGMYMVKVSNGGHYHTLSIVK